MKQGNYWPYNLDKKAEMKPAPVYPKAEEPKETAESHVSPETAVPNVESVKDHAPKIPMFNPYRAIDDDLDWADDWDDEKDSID